MAGERLALQIQQLESAYLGKNTRRYVVTQSFSVAQIAPGALLDLRETGGCEFSLPEVLFHVAYPGQYKHRCASRSRASAGPYTNVSAKLTLKQSQIRTEPTIDPADLVLMPIQTTPSIATSTAQNDGGLFELNFRDERFLPFEGAGAVSTWGLELSTCCGQFKIPFQPDLIIDLTRRRRRRGLVRFHYFQSQTPRLSLTNGRVTIS